MRSPDSTSLAYAPSQPTAGGAGGVIGRLYRDAGSIALSSLVSAALGFVFWAVAARSQTPAHLGVQTALLAAILGPASIIAPGIGDALNATVPRAAHYRSAMVRHGYLLVVALATPVGVLAGAMAMVSLPATRNSFAAGVTVAVGTVAWALFTVQDSALTTLGRARWLALENGLAGMVKLAILPLLLGLAFPVVWATLLPAMVAVAVLAPIIERLSRTDRRPGPADSAELAGARAALSRMAVRTTTSVALTLGALTFLPFVVTALAGPAQGAVFALSLSIVSVLDFVTAGVGTSLLVHTAANAGHEAALARAALTRTVPLVSAGAVALIALSGEVLKLLNRSYLSLHGVLIISILAVTSVLRIVYLIWSSLQQARQQMAPVLRLNAVAVCVAYLLVILCCPRWGALGAAGALAAAQLVLSGGAGHTLLRRRRQDLAMAP